MCCLSARPQPDIADLIKTSDLKVFSSREKEVDRCEQFFRSSDTKYKPMLGAFTDERSTAYYMRVLKGSVIRVALNKPPRKDFEPKVKSGTITDEKLEVIVVAWKKFVERVAQPSQESGWEFAVPEETLVAVPDVSGEDGSLVENNAKEMLEFGYTPGRAVQVKKRVTGEVVTDFQAKKRKCPRKDVVPGINGKIVSYDAPTQCHLYVHFIIGEETVKASVHVDNLIFVKSDGQPDEPTKAGTNGIRGKYSFLNREGDTSDSVAVHDKWDKHSCTAPSFYVQRYHTMQRNLLALGADVCLSEFAAPTASDLCVCERNGKVEVWTLKEFAKNKLIIPAFSTELKERFWTYGKAALCQSDVKKPLCMDGRLWSKLPKKAEKTDTKKAEKTDAEHVSSHFSLYWLIDLTIDKKLANLSKTNVKLDFSMTMSMPDKKTTVEER